MPVNELGQYSSNHKAWDHVGNVLPNVEYSEGFRPHGAFRPAPWLPVQFFEKHFEEHYVVMPGKGIAFDNNGHIVPAQYGLSGATITYTATDVEAGVVDVRTGSALQIGDVGSFAASGVTDFMGLGSTLAVSKPAGVAQYALYQWAGDNGEYDDGSNPVGFRKHNFQLQHQVAFLCDYALELPLVPAQTTTEALTQDSNASNVSVLNALANLPVAANTQRTAFVFAEGVGAPGDVAARFANQVSKSTDVKAMGDWHVDLNTGVITVYSTGAIGATDYTLTYHNYASSPTGSNVSKFACALGDLKPGDFLKMNADSNWVVASGSDSFQDVLGQVLEVKNVANQSLLGSVRTAYSNLSSSAAGALPGYAGQLDQMPGSANGGVPSNVHYAGAANLVVTVNLVSR